MLSTAAVLIKMLTMSISSEHFSSVHSPGWNANSLENKGCWCEMLQLYCPLSYCSILYILEIPWCIKYMDRSDRKDKAFPVALGHWFSTSFTLSKDVSVTTNWRRITCFTSLSLLNFSLLSNQHKANHSCLEATTIVRRELLELNSRSERHNFIGHICNGSAFTVWTCKTTRPRREKHNLLAIMTFQPTTSTPL